MWKSVLLNYMLKESRYVAKGSHFFFTCNIVRCRYVHTFCNNDSRARFDSCVSHRYVPHHTEPSELTVRQWPTNTESVTGIKWGGELPAHHTIISIVWLWEGSNPFALVCNIWWMSEVFGVKSAVSSCLPCSAATTHFASKVPGFFNASTTPAITRDV